MSRTPDNKEFVESIERHKYRGYNLTTTQALLSETEKLLNGWKHPDPYVPPTAPGGTDTLNRQWVWTT